MFRLGIAAKLALVTFFLLLFLTAGSLFTVRHNFGYQLRAQASREIRAASRTLGSVVERSAGQLLERGRILVELPSLRSALTKDPAKLEPLLQEVKSLRAANLLWATDTKGTVLSSTGEYPPLGQDQSQNPFCRTALEGQESTGFDLFHDEWWLVLTLPVKEEGRVIGTVTMALLIGEMYLNRLSELLGTQVGFIWGEHQIWSPQWPEETRPQISAQLIQGLSDSPRETSQGTDGKIIWLARPVTGGDPPILSGPIGVLGIQLDESVIKRSSRVIGWVAFVTMVVGAFLSLWTVRPLVQQLEEAQKQLLQVEKLASVGQLAAGVAHELNNPLMVILGNTQLAMRTLRQTEATVTPAQREEIGELLKDLEKESHRARMIVSNLLDFVRVKPPTRVKTQVPALLDESLRLVGHQASLQSIRVEKEYPSGLPDVMADPGQLQQVFVNVIVNAVQAMPKGGTLNLRVKADGSHVTVAIQDTGMGVPKDQMAKVFDPFFTTKEVGEGTGLGLFVSYGIIQRHEGTIRLASEVGKGTTVTIQLPLSR